MVELALHKIGYHQKVERIYQLLEAESSALTRTTRSRRTAQLGRSTCPYGDGLVTLIECRIHKQPRGVTWIDEFIGRRLRFGVRL
jgi:hypothetical protein